MRRLGAVAIVAFLLSCTSKVEPTAQAGAKAEAGKAAPVDATATGVKLCEHKVPADLCTQCNPELSAVFRASGDWCQEHGAPESHCFKCNPKITFDQPAAPSDWCNEHAVPESMCTKCKPQLIAKYVEAGDYCREHGYPESVCPYCHPEKLGGHSLPQFPAPGTKVRLASPETEKRAGIETQRVEAQTIAKSIEVVGRVQFNQNRLARLSARGDGVVVSVSADIGDDVKRGQPLAVLASGDIGEHQARLASARARLDAARSALQRDEGLLPSGIATKKGVEQLRAEAVAAEADYQGVKAALSGAGVGEQGSNGQYALAAPFDGTVVTRDAVAGKNVSRESMILEVADLSTMWIMLDLPEEQARLVLPGARVILRIDGSDAEPLEGLIARVGASVDPRTRTVAARVELPNPDRTVRSGMFLKARVEIGGRHGALLVPRDAIQRAQQTNLVFVRTSPGVFEPVTVEVGQRVGSMMEVAGLMSGADVVTTGAFVLKTEILKDSIGAGCADD